MGIKYFFRYLRDSFNQNIYRMGKQETLADVIEDPTADPSEPADLSDPPVGVEVDNLLIDMNGIFHGSAQKVYEYGNCKPVKRLLGQRRRVIGGVQKQIAVFEDVCKTVEHVVNVVKPRKRLIMCVDGVAPCAKQCQQRKRRFMSALERDKNDTQTFDSNSISPGTKFMDFLTKYVDWYIRKRMSEEGSLWENLEVVFSNEKSFGEGEHKLLNFIRKYGNPEEVYCIHGMDADLIMLALGTHIPKFYILREDQVDPNCSFHLINVGTLSKDLAELMRWEGDTFDPKTAMDDFILMCFTVGNDFLPHLPAIEIVEGGIDFMMDVYRKVGKAYGHLTKKTEKGVKFRKTALKHFLGSVGQQEKGILENKLLHKDHYFPDPCLERNAAYGASSRPREPSLPARYTVNIENYRQDYYASNLPDVPLERLCHEYLEGMQWVLSYYTQGVPNWNWRFPFHYAPFSATLAEHVDTFKFPEYPITSPSVPFVQLLAILPPKSSTLLPEPLNYILTDEKSPMTRFCPEDFDIDLSGKKQEWEGTVILPIVDYAVLEKAYYQVIKYVDERERKRNTAGKSFLYKKVDKDFMFRSFYGDIISKVSTVPIEI